MFRRQKRIRSIVEKLLSDAMIYIPSVDVERIAKSQNIEVRRKDLKDISGLIYRDGNQVIIGINERDTESRQRFTIAHELGHYFLHTQTPLYVDKGIDKGFPIKKRDQSSSEAVNPEEVEANAFAAELLMPVLMISNEIKEIQKDGFDEIIDHLANRFKVSKQAMTIRLSNLGFFQEEL